MKPTYEELEIIVANQAMLIDQLTLKIEELTIKNEKLTSKVEELSKQLNIYNGPNTPSSQIPNYKREKKESCVFHPLSIFLGVFLDNLKVVRYSFN